MSLLPSKKATSVAFFAPSAAAKFQGIGLLLFVASWLAYDHYRPWINFHSEALALAGIFGMVVAALLFSRRSIAVPRAALAVAAVALVPWMQWFGGVSLFVSDALLCSVYLLAAALAVWLGFLWAHQQNAGDLNRFDLAIAWAAIASAAIGLVQWLMLADSVGMYMMQPDAGDRALGNMGQPNQLATLLLMGGVLLVGLFRRRVLGSRVTLFAAGFLTLVVVLAQSRTAAVSALALTVLLATKSRSLRWWALAWIIAFGALTLVFPSAAEFLMISNGRGAGLGNTSNRLEIWSQVVYAIREAPLLGYGWNQTPTAQMTGALFHAGSTTYTNAHNILLDLVAWNGIPLGVLLIGTGAYWLVSRFLRVRDDDIGLTAMAALVPLVVHSLTEYPFAYSYFMLLGAVLVGVIEARCAPLAVRSVRRLAVGSVLAVLMVVGSYTCYEYLKVEEDFRVVRFENLRIGKTPSEYQVPEIHLLTHMGAMLKAARIVPTPGMNAEDFELLHKVSQRFAFGPLSYRYALALALNGDPVGAARQLLVVKNVYGRAYYAAVKDEFKRLEREQYPRLGAIQLP